MGVPTEPVTLSPQNIAEILKQYSKARHDINNALSLITAATELIRMNPNNVPKMLSTLSDQPGKITSTLKQLTADLDRALQPHKIS